MRELSNAPPDAIEACLDLMNFGQNWEDWKDSLQETINAAREIDPSDRHVIGVVEDMIDFLSKRACTGSPEEKFISELWDRADPAQRHTLAHIFLKMIEARPPSGSP